MSGDMSGEEFGAVLDAARAGGEWAIAALYDQLAPSVARYLRAQVGQDAEDVASETWLSVARGLTTFTGDQDAFRAWVFTIAKRRVVDHLRSRGRRRTAPAEVGVEPSAEDTALAGRIGDEAARRIVALLPADQAQVVLLRVVAGLPVEEVARIMGRRPGTIRVLQHRALRRLAEEISGDQ